MASQASIREAVAAALHAKDTGRLLPLCRQLDSNFIVPGFHYEDSVAHHVTGLENGLACIEALVETLGPGCLTCTNEDNDTPIHLAALYQDQSWMELICRTLGPACFHQPGQVQKTVIQFAAMNETDNSCLIWLIKKCGTECLSVRDQQGNTPVHLAAWKQGADSMELFKSVLGADCFHQRGNYRRTVIHVAAMNEKDNSCLRWLVKECGTDCLAVEDEHGNTPVHLAAEFQGAESMKLFKSVLGSDCFRQPGNCDRTAIHAAATNELTNSSLKWFVSNLAPSCLLDKDSDGATPVHLAAECQGLDSLRCIVHSLAAIGVAAFELVDAEGQTVADYAERNAEHGPRLREWISEQRQQLQSVPALLRGSELAVLSCTAIVLSFLIYFCFH